MRQENLASYLNDHLAGSVAALELIDHLVAISSGSPKGAFFKKLHAEIEADQDVLRGLLARWQAGESGVRKAAAWLLEKAGWAKLKLAGTDDDGIGRLQALEGLVLGITGKLALWRALQTAFGSIEGADLAHLIRRAEDQRAQVEEERLAAAKTAFRD